ncbi:MAG: hypothetical protein ACXV7F_10835 [Methylomonas sp.]
MNIIKVTMISLLLTMSFGAASTTAYAEEAPIGSSTEVSETISHIEDALIDISENDINSAQVELKAALDFAEKINGNEDIVKKANALVMEAQMKAKLGEIKSASENLNKALELYRSL